LFDGQGGTPGRFEGSAMDAFMAVKRGEAWRSCAHARAPVRTGARLQVTDPDEMPARSDVATDRPVPARPSSATGSSRASRCASTRLPRRAGHVHGQWGLKLRPRRDGPSTRSWSRRRTATLRMLLDGCRARGCAGRGGLRLLPGGQRGNDLVVTAVTGRSGSGTRSRGSAMTGTCAWPTFLPAPADSGDTDVVVSSWSP